MASKRVQRHFAAELWKLRIQSLILLSCGIITLGMFATLAIRWPQQVGVAIPVLHMAVIFFVGALMGLLLQYGLARWMLRRGLIAHIPSWNIRQGADL
jgi:cation transporter-like permease